MEEEDFPNSSWSLILILKFLMEELINLICPWFSGAKEGEEEEEEGEEEEEEGEEEEERGEEEEEDE